MFWKIDPLLSNTVMNYSSTSVFHGFIRLFSTSLHGLCSWVSLFGKPVQKKSLYKLFSDRSMEYRTVVICTTLTYLRAFRRPSTEFSGWSFNTFIVAFIWKTKLKCITHNLRFSCHFSLHRFTRKTCKTTNPEISRIFFKWTTVQDCTAPFQWFSLFDLPPFLSLSHQMSNAGQKYQTNKLTSMLDVLTKAPTGWTWSYKIITPTYKKMQCFKRSD